MNRRQVLIGGGAAAAGIAGAAAFCAAQTGSMATYRTAAAAMRKQVPGAPALVDAVRCATLAANGHNSQPWRFRLERQRIAIVPDFSRRTPVVDPDDHHLFTSLGCAAENLALAAAAHGYHGELRFDREQSSAVLLSLDRGPPILSPLLGAIPRRQSTRTLYDGGPVAAADLNALASAAEVPGVDLVLITDRRQIERVRELIVAANTVQMSDPAFIRELKSWLRFSPRQALATGDGLFTAASGNPVMPPWIGRPLFDFVFRADIENDRYARQLRSSAGLAVFVSARDDRDHWIRAGRACQRFALQATALGLKCAFVNQPVEVAAMRPQLAALLGLPGGRIDLVMRFGCGPALPFSPRRPLEAVLVPASPEQ